MKTIFTTFTILLFVINYSCQAQQTVQVPNDVYKLKANEQQFINKPLKDLLKDLKPEIKMAYSNFESPDFFSFRFVDSETLKKDGIDRHHLGLYIYVKEPIDWKFEKRPKGKEYVWTKEDEEKYGNLTVIRIRVTGKD